VKERSCTCQGLPLARESSSCRVVALEFIRFTQPFTITANFSAVNCHSDGQSRSIPRMSRQIAQHPTAGLGCVRPCDQQNPAIAGPHAIARGLRRKRLPRDHFTLPAFLRDQSLSQRHVTLVRLRPPRLPFRPFWADARSDFSVRSHMVRSLLLLVIVSYRRRTAGWVIIRAVLSPRQPGQAVR
jgi:hypothetical protein